MICMIISASFLKPDCFMLKLIMSEMVAAYIIRIRNGAMLGYANWRIAPIFSSNHTGWNLILSISPLSQISEQKRTPHCWGVLQMDGIEPISNRFPSSFWVKWGWLSAQIRSPKDSKHHAVPVLPFIWQAWLPKNNFSVWNEGCIYNLLSTMEIASILESIRKVVRVELASIAMGMGRV